MTAKIETGMESGTVVFVPLNTLKKSPKNVRKTPHAEVEIEALAASIAVKGMLQNLVCQSAPNIDPLSASNVDPLERRVLTVALAPSELVGVAETARARAA